MHRLLLFSRGLTSTGESRKLFVDNTDICISTQIRRLDLFHWERDFILYVRTLYQIHVCIYIYIIFIDLLYNNNRLSIIHMNNLYVRKIIFELKLISIQY